MNFLRLMPSTLSVFSAIVFLSCQKSVESGPSSSAPRPSQETINNLNDEAYGENDPVFAENKALDNYDPYSPDSRAQTALQLPELAHHINSPDLPDQVASQDSDPIESLEQEKDDGTNGFPQKVSENNGCSRNATWNCALHIIVAKKSQRLYIENYGEPLPTVISNKVSTGVANKPTPDFHGHPGGWPVEKKTSTLYPNGDWNGYGNMPYALPLGKPKYFIHGTGSIRNLGKPASHGCIRIHPLQARIIYQWITKYIKAQGLSRKDIYISVQDNWTPKKLNSIPQTASWSNEGPHLSGPKENLKTVFTNIKREENLETF